MKSKDLAKILNVSPATVSMVLNNKPGISDETREMILEAAKKYGMKIKGNINNMEKLPVRYVIYKKTGEIVGDTPCFFQLTEGITHACQKIGCPIQISYFYGNDYLAPQFEEIVNSKCSGMILLGTELDEEMFFAFKNLGLPMVLLDTYKDEFDVNSVLINNIQGAFTATNYLINHGHTKVGYLKCSARMTNFRERADGYYKALRRNDIPFDHPYVHILTADITQGYMDMCKILEEKPPLATAYFADNDVIGAAAMRAFKDYGYRIPEDVSIIGFDNSPECQILSPMLSTMNVDMSKLGEIAVMRLLEILQGDTNVSLKVCLSTELVERESVKTIK